MKNFSNFINNVWISGFVLLFLGVYAEWRMDRWDGVFFWGDYLVIIFSIAVLFISLGSQFFRIELKESEVISAPQRSKIKILYIPKNWFSVLLFKLLKFVFFISFFEKKQNKKLETADNRKAVSLIQPFRVLGICYRENEEFNQKVMPEIAKLTYLTELDLTASPVNDEGLLLLKNLKRLKVLKVTSNFLITDKGLEVIENFPELTELSLNTCRNIEGKFFDGLGKKIRILDLSSTTITSRTVSHLHDKKSLRSISLTKSYCWDLNDTRESRFSAPDVNILETMLTRCSVSYDN
jgi:hypothetical protein